MGKVYPPSQTIPRSRHLWDVNGFLSLFSLRLPRGFSSRKFMAPVVAIPCWILPGIKKKAGKKKKRKERGSTFQLLGRIPGHLDVNHPLESKEKALVKIPLGAKMSRILWKAPPAPSLTGPRPGKNSDRKNKNRNFGVSRAVIPTGNLAGWGGLLLEPVLAFLILIPNPIPHPMPQDVLPPAQGSLWIPCFPHGWKVCGRGQERAEGQGWEGKGEWDTQGKVG